ncbi:putative glutathione peroxidase [Klebsiella pneumoniae]|nr:putative glutathione peroxidase [Klebsiella pneumoniae]
MTPFYQLTATRLRGQPLSMADYAGKVVLVVNTASHCGFTPQYAGLEALYKKYAAQGLVVLGFPCNQFGKQEPGGADEIEQTCHVNYGVSFPMFEKVDVNGPAAHPLFRYLKQAFARRARRTDQVEFHQVPHRSRRHTPHAFCAVHDAGENGSLHCRGPHALSVPIMPRSPSGGWLPIQGRRRSHAASNRLLLANLPPARSSAYSGDTTSTSC